MAEKILTITNLKKNIKKKPIIKGINFNIGQGEILGFLGPNGAGKSTTLRMIVGLSRPSSGQITIGGYDITRKYVKAMAQVGCIIEGPDLYDYTTGYCNLEMLSAMSKHVTKTDIMNAVELVGMENRIYDKVGTYSMGMKQRLGLAQALIHTPKLLVLDEPTNGLDPQGIYEFRKIIKTLAREKGISVLVSSHLISEVQLMCDKVSIINQGLIVKNAEVKDLLATGEVFWVVDRPVALKSFLEDRFKLTLSLNEARLEGIVAMDQLEEINATIIQEGYKLRYASAKNKTLEELFLSITDNQSIQ